MSRRVDLSIILDWANRRVRKLYGDKCEQESYRRINDTYGRGITMLMHACNERIVKYVEYLLTFPGLEIFARCKEGYNALVYAAQAKHNRGEVIKLILNSDQLVESENYIKLR